MPNKTYGKEIPNTDIKTLTGKLIVIEGADGSGRSTQIVNISNWLETLGYSVQNVGIKRSTLVSKALNKAQKGNSLSSTTRSLFYATDFADQIENKIIPALKAGEIVLCDRYFYTLMARDLVRGAKLEWLKKLFSFALIPELVIYLRVLPENLVERNFQKNVSLNYWESGMDLGLSTDRYDSFIAYQNRIRNQFLKLKDIFNFEIIDGNQDSKIINEEIKKKIVKTLGIDYE